MNIKPMQPPRTYKEYEEALASVGEPYYRKGESEFMQPKRQSIMINPAFHRLLKIEAAKEGTSIGELIQEAYRTWKHQRLRMARTTTPT